MSNIGRPPIPTNIKLLRGNTRRKRLNANEPDPPPAIPTCPSHLNDIAKAEWKRISKELLAQGLISKLDRACLAAYCDSYAAWVAASEELQKYGLVFKSPTGFPLQSPYLAIRNTALDQMRAFLTEFGMSPSSRSRVKTANPKQRSLFEEMLDADDGVG